MGFELVEASVENLASAAGLGRDVGNHPPVVRDGYGAPDISPQGLAWWQRDRQPRGGYGIRAAWDVAHKPSGGQTSHNGAARAGDQPEPEAEMALW